MRKACHMYHVVLVAFCCIAASQRTAVQQERILSSHTGEDSCKCLEWAGLDDHIQGGFLKFRPVTNSGVTYDYPSDYGSYECKAHDQNLSPYCTGNDKADFCDQLWCYVVSTCSGVTKSESKMKAGLYWSYQTCGDASAFGKYSAADSASITMLLDVLEGYLRNTRNTMETNYKSLAQARANGNSMAQCPYNEFCSCSTCSFKPTWNGEFDFAKLAMFLQSGITPANLLDVSCLTEGLTSLYKRIANKEMDSGYTRPGFQYFAFQESGTLSQWPAQKWSAQLCSSGYDPRFRPFFAAGATGPKDVLIVVDVSGSMATAGRDMLAKRAVITILKTLSWKDFATVILFNHGILTFYSDLLKAVSEEERAAMETWVDQEDWSNGGTNFVSAFDKAFDVIKNSVAAGSTSMCQRAILFLTDGEASFSEQEFTSTVTRATQYDAILFTYALGSDANTEVTKRLACENRGVFYKVPDNGDLMSIMASYYDYFASGQEICSPSYVKFTGAVSGSEFLTGCLPSYARTSSHPKILGVGCTDVNVLADPAGLKSQSSYNEFVCRLSDISKRCRALNLDECRLQKIRRAVGVDSVCNSAAPSQAATSAQVSQAETGECGCVDHNCQDDTLWKDAKGYYCDTWIGDDCNFLWDGYSAQELADVRSKCPRSCGSCPWLNPCPYADGPPCDEMAGVGQQCRACNGKVSGNNIEGNPMCCPSGATDFAPGCSSSSGSSNTGSSNTGSGNTGSGNTGSGNTGASSASSASSDSDSGGGAPVGAIIGGVFGGLALIGIIAGAFFFFKSRGGGGGGGGGAKSGGGGGGTATRVHPDPGNDEEWKQSILPLAAGVGPAPILERPHWKNRYNDNAIEQASELVEMFQRLMAEDCWKNTYTRDRRGAAVPKKVSVQEVKHIENMGLWKKYCEARWRLKNKRSTPCTSLDKTYGGRALTMKNNDFVAKLCPECDHKINEVMLWHGTSPQAAVAIARGGFDLSYAGKGAGSMFGHGVYLAEHSSKSDEYAKDDAEGLSGAGLYALLLCRATLGNFVTLNEGGREVHDMIRSSMKSGKYESVLGDRAAAVGTYREFIVYEEAQVYPEYVILYKREY